MPGAEIIRRYGFDPEAQARARARRIELTLWELGHRAALIVTGFALAPVAKPILDTFTHAIPLRWLAVLLYTYLILVLTRWSLPFLLVHLSRMDVRDGLLEAARRPFLGALTRSLVVLLAATPIFAFVYGLSFSPWQKTDWNPVFYAVFVSFAGFLLPHLCDLYGIHRFGVEALPLFIALCETALLLASPLERALMRWAERRADRLALKATGNPAAFASTTIKLYDGNLIDAAPGRLWQLLFGSHPTGLERVKLARCWKPG